MPPDSQFDSELNATLPAAAPYPRETRPPLDDPLPFASTPSPADAGSGFISADDYISVLFRDGLDLPIEDLDLTIDIPGAGVFNSKTCPAGAVTLPMPTSRVGKANVSVKDITGKRQKVCSIDLAKCTHAVIVRSPKVLVKLASRPHQQMPPARSTPTKPVTTETSPVAKTASPTLGPRHVDTSLTWWEANGALERAWIRLKHEIGLPDEPPTAAPAHPVIARTLSAAGQPVTLMVGPECPNPQNLRLGRNNVYRDAIVAAASRLGLIPQALCALMDCEAGKLTEHIPKRGPDGQPLKDKSGKPITTPIREMWDAHAGNGQSGAAGLTQFLASTWLSHVLIPRRYIHEESVKRGWVEQDKNGTWEFVLSDGKATISPRAHRADGHVMDCLAMRLDPTWSINAAADYGVANLAVLGAKGFKLGMVCKTQFSAAARCSSEVVA